MSDTITAIHAREVLDSRGNPTVEVEVHCGAIVGRAIVPSGASTGRHEARELRDGDPDRFAGKGVRRAVANVKEIIGPKLCGMPVADQELIDRTLCSLDGTTDKSRLGANAVLGVSLASAHAAAAKCRQPLWRYIASLPGAEAAPCLPLPMVNLISGGLHAGGNVDFQDFLLLPIGARSFSEALEMSVAVYRALGDSLSRQGYEGVLVGDEGGFGPRLRINEKGLDMLLGAFSQARVEQQIAIAIDVASTQFFRDGHYVLKNRVFREGRNFIEDQAHTSQEMADLLQRLAEGYSILSIEDGMAEDDWPGWRLLTERLGPSVQLVGDDLFVTNPERLRRGIQERVANSILIKPNQIGTLTETLAVIALARSAGYRPVISARSGETEDTTIADLAVATGAGQIKIGSVVRGERLAKYNQLLRIEEQMGPSAPFARWQPLTV